MEKHREGQKELHCDFVDLEKVYDRVPREERWFCMRRSGVLERCVRGAGSVRGQSDAVRSEVGLTEEFKLELDLHQGSDLNPFLLTVVMDRRDQTGVDYGV